MNKTCGLFALAAAGALIAWCSVLHVRLARSEGERLRLEAARLELESRHRQATAQIESLRRRRSAQGAGLADAAGRRTRPAGAGDELGRAMGTAPDPSGVTTVSGQAPEPGWPLSAAVQARLVQRFGPFEIREAQPSLHEGVPAYLVRGTTADGRSLGAMITPDGDVLTSKAELPTEALPESVAAIFRELGGSTTIEKAREIYTSEAGLEYTVSGRSDDGRKINLSMSGDGRITGGELERSANDLPEPVRNTVAQTVADRGPSSVFQVLGRKGTFYEVGFDGDSDHIHLVIDELGRLVSYASKVVPPPGAAEEKLKP